MKNNFKVGQVVRWIDRYAPIDHIDGNKIYFNSDDWVHAGELHILTVKEANLPRTTPNRIRGLIQRVSHQRQRVGVKPSKAADTYVQFVYACKPDCVRCALEKAVND